MSFCVSNNGTKCLKFITELIDWKTAPTYIHTYYTQYTWHVCNLFFGFVNLLISPFGRTRLKIRFSKFLFSMSWRASTHSELCFFLAPLPFSLKLCIGYITIVLFGIFKIFAINKLIDWLNWLIVLPNAGEWTKHIGRNTLAYSRQSTHFWVCITFCRVRHGDSVTKPDYYYYYYAYHCWECTRLTQIIYKSCIMV